MQVNTRRAGLMNQLQSPDQQKEARMQDHGSGGVAFLSIGLPELVLALLILGAVTFGLWKLAQIFRAA
jgi:hypothetical protein